MNDLAVKTVDFMGDGLLAAKDNEGIIWTGVNSFCRGLGMDKKQKDSQVEKVQNDETLKRGCRKFPAGVFDPNNETLALQLDYVPLWLAKISITPNMKENNPELVEKLVNYQLKAKDVLAAAFLPQAQAHNIKQLTITSRDIAVMTTKKNLHAKVIINIKDCIKELVDMGFNPDEFFIPDSYIGGNKQENLQYLCTQRGCECYSGKLEPEARQTFINEFTDRFERMRAVIEGKPVKKLPKLISMAEVQEKEPLIRLYRNNNWGVLLMNDELYNLTPEEIKVIESFIPELQRYNIGKVQYVIKAYLASQKRDSKLEEIASWGVKEEKPQVPLLPDKTKKKQADDKDYNAPFITAKQAQSRYNMSYGKVAQLAKESGAWIKYGKAIRINTKKMDEYLTKEYTE